MRAVKLRAQVTRDHTLQLKLPEDIEEGPAEVIVLVADSGEEEPSAGSLEDFLAAPRVNRRFIRSKEEIDEYLRTERESWE